MSGTALLILRFAALVNTLAVLLHIIRVGFTEWDAIVWINTCVVAIWIACETWRLR